MFPGNITAPHGIALLEPEKISWVCYDGTDPIYTN